ncbi:GDP-L-fucose synthase [Bosea vaviloviae]|uniref:GDP-L-fucose synthase n=1 Tax=Bosea vaviloviae TaxID=1526658 RepID=A0A1D7TZ35_9HYPH|nr:GDP-L-fucose synthase [Bosea vaviloviae]AOO80381.1 GDP-fucose synthetase [Bosea vaviloviae]
MPDKHYNLAGKRVWVAGHRGMVGSALVRALEARGIAPITVRRADVDLRRQAEVEAWMGKERPEVVFLAAAKVGGILANKTYPSDFLFDNLAIAMNVIHASASLGVEKLLFLGSTCIYPKFADQPIREEALLTGSLEPTNEWYAIAKIAGLKLAESYRLQQGCDFISAMPTNLYGPNDNFDLKSSHVLPALLRKIHEAKTRGTGAVEIWGSGTPRREFLHVDDLADASLHIAEHYSDALHLNVGTGVDVTIRELAEQIAEVVGYEGSFVFDPSKPDGTPRKCTDISRLNALGWRPRFDLRSGIEMTYRWFLTQNELLERV